MTAIMLSTNPAKTNAKVLAGLRVAVPAYVFIPSEAGISKVVFLLDGNVVHTELGAPWDFSPINAKAAPYDFTQLRAGAHTIAARIYRGTTSYTTLLAPFTVVRPTVTVSPAPVRGTVGVRQPRVAAQHDMTVTSPVAVTHSPEVQDLSYVTSEAT